MNVLQVMDRYWTEVIQVSTQKNDLKVQYQQATFKLLPASQPASNPNICFYCGMVCSSLYKNLHLNQN